MFLDFDKRSLFWPQVHVCPRKWLKFWCLACNFQKLINTEYDLVASVEVARHEKQKLFDDRKTIVERVNRLREELETPPAKVLRNCPARVFCPSFRNKCSRFETEPLLMTNNGIESTPRAPSLPESLHVCLSFSRRGGHWTTAMQVNQKNRRPSANRSNSWKRK